MNKPQVPLAQGLHVLSIPLMRKNIPCVIGTRNGTKAFKTGDLIEVDATRGIIRKIS